MAANKDEGIGDEVVDQLLAGRDPATVFESGGLIDELKKRLAERMLNAEMEHHLGVPRRRSHAITATARGVRP
jgi:putative transposase